MNCNHSAAKNARQSTSTRRVVCMVCVKRFSFDADRTKNISLLSAMYPHICGNLCHDCAKLFRANVEDPRFYDARALLNAYSKQYTIWLLEDNPSEKYLVELAEDVRNFSFVNRPSLAPPADRAAYVRELATNLPYPIWVTLFKRRSADTQASGGQA
jgi:hypothetical protein